MADCFPVVGRFRFKAWRIANGNICPVNYLMLTGMAIFNMVMRYYAVNKNHTPCSKHRQSFYFCTPFQPINLSTINHSTINHSTFNLASPV
ncbi:MAG: hypothetical protein HPY62_13750 [Bacteroidales bacterium]|nr:hypothetical protein [Bacteroidales bacterium]